MPPHPTPKAFTRKLQMSIPPSGGSRDIIVRIGLPEPDPLPGGDFRLGSSRGKLSLARR